MCCVICMCCVTTITSLIYQQLCQETKLGRTIFFQTADLTNANLEGANLEGANLKVEDCVINQFTHILFDISV